MGIANNGGFRHLLVGVQGRLDLGGPHPVSGDVDHVVDAAGDPVIPVAVPKRAVAGKIVTRERFEIGCLVFLVIAVDRPGEAGPGPLDAEGAAADQTRHLNTCRVVHQGRNHPHDRERRQRRLDRNRTGERQDHETAGLGLPPGIHNRALIAADYAVIPVPCLRVQGFADGAENPDRGEIDPLHPLVSLFGDRPNGRRGGVELGHLVLLDDLPEPAVVRIVGDALEHNGGGAIAERPVDNVAMARHPADVGGAPPDIIFVNIEGELVRVGHEEQIARRGVEGALGLPGGTGGVEDEEGILGIHPFGLAFRVNLRHLLVPPEVSAGGPVHFDLVADPLQHDHLLDGGAILHGRVGILLLGNRLGAAEASVADDENLGFGIPYTGGEGVGAEAAENDGMDGADAGAGQHGDTGLGNHRHVDADAVSLLYAV